MITTILPGERSILNTEVFSNFASGILGNSYHMIKNKSPQIQPASVSCYIITWPNNSRYKLSLRASQLNLKPIMLGQPNLPTLHCGYTNLGQNFAMLLKGIFALYWIKFSMRPKRNGIL